MVKTENFKQIEVSSQKELRTWLEMNYAQEKSVWLVTFKKNVPEKYVSRWEVLDELICFGWIDGIRRKLNEEKTMQLISPRKVEHWARTYKERAAKLIEASKKSGLWDFMVDVDNLIIPKDLIKALERHDGALEFFENINDSSKRFALRWVKLAKTDKTRNNRILKLATLSAKGEKLPGS